jgi:hypothetical protein
MGKRNYIMKALDIYLNEINDRRALFGLAPLDLRKDFEEVYAEVNALGSPEILSKDGELSTGETRGRTNFWLDAMTDLDEVYEEIA